MAQFSLELRFRVAFLAVLLPLASGACVDLDLGMGRGTIPNSNITASSVQNATTSAKNGRLNYTSGSSWCARTNDTNPYLQIDLQTPHIICAVSTQGNSQADQWVKNYTLQLSTNGTTWTDYKEGEQGKFLRGNDDRNSEVKHVVYKVLTRYLRFLPKTHQGGVCMRTEVFGVEQKLRCSMRAIGVAKRDTIPDSSFSASSEFNSVYPAKYGRLNNTKSWAPKGNNGNDYLQIDLLFEYIICAVATQGNPRAKEWMTKYKFQSSLNSANFVTYQENSADKVFPGNSNQNGIVKNSLQEFASAKFIRFQPTAFSDYKGLRVEVYGVLLTKVPSQPPTDFKLTASSSTSIVASWQLPPIFARHGRTITGFVLFYKKKHSGVPATKLNITDGSTLSRNVTGLDKYTEYEFQVLAYTSDGNGPKSPVEIERTKEAAPSQAPSRFSVSAVTSTIITASWQLPSVGSRNGIIKGFKLFYKKRGSKESNILRINNGTALSTDVSGLEIYTEYEFEVLTFTSAGDGPKSIPVVIVRTRKDGCVEFNLGMEDGRIPDSGISASPSSTPAKNGRLNYTSGSSWCAGTSATNPYLQIDLQTLHIICAVSTQGNSKGDQWVKTYRLQLSTDGTNWADYMESGQVKVLRGNYDRNSYMKHVVYGVLTRYVRFLPETHQGGVCMRTEVFGVKQKPTCDRNAIGLEDVGKIPDSSFTASSHFSGAYVAKNGRLNNDKAWGSKNNKIADDYLQIDLLYEYIICAIATQGNPKSNTDAQEWITYYKIRLSLNDTTFDTYRENNNEKVFPGNTDKDSIVKNSLNKSSSARYIRLVPTQQHGHKILRVEVYGIPLTKVPSQPPASFKLTASSSNSITASWQLPPSCARHGRNIEGFKLFYREKGFTGPFSFLNITSGSTLSRLVAGLHAYTEYEFQVLAYTSSGDGPKSFVEVETTMEGAPSQPPSNFKVTAISSTSVTVSWQLPPEGFRNGIIKGFKLFYERKDSSGSGNILTINSESTLDKDVNGLEKYTEYEFRVLAFTSAGDGANSSVVPKRTKEDVPSQPPNGFTLTAATSTSITASWQLPPADSRNGIIIGFKLFYKKKGSFGSPNEQLIGDQATRTKEVTGLNKYTEYEFQILAFTSVGDGKRSAPVFKKTKEDAPSQPPSQIIVTVNSSTSITASWKLPPEDSRHGIIRGFKLYYKKKDSSSATSLTINNGKTSTTRVTKLDEYTEYEFQVLAFTSAGDGPNSSAVFRTTMENAPSAPTSLSSVGVPPSSSHGPRIILFWSKPTEPNGVIRSYNMFYSHDGGAPVMISGIDKNAFSHTVDVLGGVTYQFHVRAVTIKPGPNQTIAVTTKEYEPSRGPEEISSAALNSTNINITWLGLPREVAYGYVIRYEVRLIVVENCTQIQSAFHSTINTTITYVLVTGLSFCAKYEVSVRGYTAVGPGPYSRPVMVQTLAEMWSKERPSSPSFSANSKGGGISAKVMLPRFPGNARFFQVIIITYSSNYTGAVKPPGRFTTQDMVTYEEAHKSFVPAPYVAFQFGGNDFYKNKEFVIGDGAQSGGKERRKRSSGDQVYYNKPLQLNTNYRVFIRAFVSETVYVSSNFVTIDTKGKPIIKNLPKRTITAVGELVVLTCEVNRDPEASVTWTKDGLTSIARAQLDNNAKILVIKDVVPGDSGVYECKAVNMFGESRTATIVIVAVPPRIIEELSPSSVICEKQTPCFLSCQATSYIPFNSSWTKDGRVPTGDNMKLLNNSLIVTPRDAQDYGDYVCHATNTFGSTMYKITLVPPMDNQDLDDDTQSILLACVIPLSCIVLVLLIIICGLIWQRRRAVPIKMIQSKEEIDFDGVKSSPDQLSRDEQSSDPNTYMELKSRPSNRESHVPSEYQSFQEKPENLGYYNMVLQKESDGKQNEEVYEEI